MMSASTVVSIPIQPQAGVTDKILATAPAKARTLWRIADDLTALEDLLDENDGDITACEEAVDQWFAELKGDESRKIDGYAAYIAELTARSEARKEEADRLAHRAKVDSNLAANLKLRLKQHFERQGKTKFETARYKLSVCKAGGKPPLILIDEAVRDPSQLPEKFRKTTTVVAPDKDAIRAALEAGDADALGFATFGQGSTYLKIS